MVCRMDKNLGPAIIECATYIQSALTEHLLHANTYQKLSKANTEQEMTKTSHAISSWLRQYKDILPKNEYTYHSAPTSSMTKKATLLSHNFTYLLKYTRTQPPLVPSFQSAAASSMASAIGPTANCNHTAARSPPSSKALRPTYIDSENSKPDCHYPQRPYYSPATQ